MNLLKTAQIVTSLTTTRCGRRFFPSRRFVNKKVSSFAPSSTLFFSALLAKVNPTFYGGVGGVGGGVSSLSVCPFLSRHNVVFFFFPKKVLGNTKLFIRFLALNVKSPPERTASVGHSSTLLSIHRWCLKLHIMGRSIKDR